MSNSYYDTAQICLNGHMINSSARNYPRSNQKFCDQCGERSITKCESCETDIRGYYNVEGVIAMSSPDCPSYCHECGKAYSWTARTLDAAYDLADELDELSDADREKLKSSLPDLIRDGPRTSLAETRFKKIMKSAGQDTYEGMKAILLNVVTEAVKKSLFGG